MDGHRSIRSLTGLRRDSEVMYVGTFSNTAPHQRGKIADVFAVEDDEGEEAGDSFDALPKSNLIR